MKVIVQPGLVAGRIQAIPSKSVAHRALICAALADGRSNIVVDRSSVDIDATANALKALGARIERTDDAFVVDAIETMPAEPLLDCVESGSTLRFLLPVGAAVHPEVRFTGTGRLPERPLDPLQSQMEAHGCRFSQKKLPFTVFGPMAGGTFELPGDVSSQFVSGLLMAAPKLVGHTSVQLLSRLESRDYVSITTEVMRDFGVQVVETHAGYAVAPGQAYRAGDYIVEGDWSNAAFLLVSGALGEPITVAGLRGDSAQGDRGILQVLCDFGAVVEETREAITVRPGDRNPIRVDLSVMPDALPALSILAASVAEGTSEFFNGKRLRLKESDRLQTVAAMITALGGNAEEREDGLLIHGTGGLHGGKVSSFGDHRIAMAATTGSVIAKEPIEIEQAEAVQKSYPAFFEDWARLGGKCHVQ